MGWKQRLAQGHRFVVEASAHFAFWPVVAGGAVAIVGACGFVLAQATPVIELFAPFSYWIAALLAVIFLTFAAAGVLNVRAALSKLRVTPAPAPHVPDTGERLMEASRRGNRGYEPDYAIWDTHETLRLFEAAYLWVDVRPPTQPIAPSEGHAAEAYTMLLAAIRRREMAKGQTFSGRRILVGDGDARIIPAGVHPDTLVTRLELIEFATANKRQPRFLFPSARAPEPSG
jgi:hypothetical protein